MLYVKLWVILWYVLESITDQGGKRGFILDRGMWFCLLEAVTNVNQATCGQKTMGIWDCRKTICIVKYHKWVRSQHGVYTKQKKETLSGDTLQKNTFIKGLLNYKRKGTEPLNHPSYEESKKRSALSSLCSVLAKERANYAGRMVAVRQKILVCLVLVLEAYLYFCWFVTISIRIPYSWYYLNLCHFVNKLILLSP